MIRIVVAMALCAGPALARPPGPPDCTGIEAWPAAMAYGALKNAGDLSPETVDFSKRRSVRIASEQIGRDLYRQVHRVTFGLKDGRTIEVLTISDASHEECSMSDVTVFVVAKRLP